MAGEVAEPACIMDLGLVLRTQIHKGAPGYVLILIDSQRGVQG